MRWTFEGALGAGELAGPWWAELSQVSRGNGRDERYKLPSQLAVRRELGRERVRKSGDVWYQRTCMRHRRSLPSAALRDERIATS
jgi:hypothetical protein